MQPTIAIALAPAVATTSLDFSKYLNYIYFATTGKLQNGCIWIHDYNNFSKVNFTIPIQKNNLDNDIVEVEKLLKLWILADMVVLSTLTTNIMKNETKLDFAQILS